MHVSIVRACGPALALGFSIVAPLAARTATDEVRVPFVGCRSDGQQGPLAAPKGRAIAVKTDPLTAGLLAFYQSGSGVGVLGPRGWSCFGLYGSDGASLLVTPRPLRTTDLFSPDFKGIDGPAIQASQDLGGTSGRYAVARAIAQVFPGETAFLKSVIAEGIRPSSEFPQGPFPDDKLGSRGERVIEYETPAHAAGLGTDSRLQASDQPIRGVLILQGDTPDLMSLAVRLPSTFENLAPYIIAAFERDNADSK